MEIILKKGLDVPLAAAPEGSIQELSHPKKIALNLEPFSYIRFKVHVKVGERVKVGQPLAESKTTPGLAFVSPAGGVVSEVRRGLKRRLLDIVIDVDENEAFEEHGFFDLEEASREAVVDLLMKSGLFPYIRLRPFDLIAAPNYLPRDIFVSAVESLPFLPPAEMQLEGNEALYQAGLDALSKLTDGKVHLVHREGSLFTKMNNVEHHTVAGPHPAGMSSVHIHEVAPIRSASDFVWTLSTIGVLAIGKMILEGRYFTDRIISIAGEGVVKGRGGYFRGRAGHPIADLIANRIDNKALRLISGDPLTGSQTQGDDFLQFYHTSFTAIPENTRRQLLHFFRPGFNKYSATGAYFTGHIKPPKEGYHFTTNQHGEERAFIDGNIYDRVMPMRVPTMHLVKAIISEDFELAESLGLLEVCPDDFALPAFICPSKIEMIDIVKNGLHLYSQEMGF